MMILVSMTAPAQLLKFNTFGNAGTETSEPSTFNDANIASTSLTYSGSTVTPAGNTNRFGGSSWGVGALNTAKYIQFIVTPNAGFSFTPTSLVFIWDFSGTGPSAVTLRSSTDGFATFTDLGTLTGMTTSTSVFKTINISALTNVTVATTFRLYGYNATAAGGTGGFDCASSLTNGNIQFNGTTAAATPPVVTAESLTGTVGVSYSHNITATNSPSSYTISTGTLPAGLSLNTTSGAITGTPTTAGTSSVDIYASNGAGAGSAATINFTINPGSQTITGLAPTDNSRTFGDAPYNLTATGGASGNPVTYAASPAGVVTIVGSQVTIVGAGTTTITASQAGNTNYNAATDVTQTLNVNQASQTITFAALSPKPDNAANFQLTATGGASGNPVTYTSSNTAVAIIVDNLGNPDPNGNWVDILSAGSTTITASQAGNTNYLSATPVQQILLVNSTSLIDQVISNFPATDTRTYGDANYQLTATGGGSGNPVTYASLDPSVAVIVNSLGNPDPNGDRVKIIKNGVVTIRASQAGNALYNPAIDADQVLTVNQREITISGAVANDKPYDGTNTASITGYTVNGIVAGDNVTVSSGGTFASVNAGTWTVTAAFSKSGTDASKYFLTQPTGLSATISQLAQVINFGALVAKTYGNPDFVLTSTGGASGNPVTYTSSDPSVATIVNNLGIVDPNGGFIHIVGAGSTTITASQLGNTNYSDAVSVPQTQLVNQAAQTISFAALVNKTTADAPFTLSAVSNSGATPTGLPITYTSSNPAVADVVGNVVTIYGRGTTDITASQAGNTNYLPATSVTRTLIVTAPLIAAWDFTGPGGTGITTFAASIFNADLSSSNLITRGATAASSVGVNSFRTTGFKNDGISTSNTDYFQTTLAVTTGKILSLSDITAKFSGTLTFVTGSPATPPGGVSFQFAYSLNGTTFTPIGSSPAVIGSSASTSATLTMSPIDLSGITALQNVPSGTTVTFRYYASGQTTTGGWGFFSASVGDNGLAFGGAITNDCITDISTADFRTKGTSGDISNPSTWEYQNSCGNWVDATQAPASGNFCFCRPGFSGTKNVLSPPMTIKGLDIASGASLDLSGSLTSGTVQVKGTLTVQHSGYLLGANDQPVSVSTGGTLLNDGTIELTGDLTVDGHFRGTNPGHGGSLRFSGAAIQTVTVNSDDNNLEIVSVDKTSNSSELRIHNNAALTTLDMASLDVEKGTVKFFNQTKGFRSSCQVRFGANSTCSMGTSSLSVGCDLIVNGQYDGASGQLTFDGISAQVLDYSPDPASPPSNFGEVTCNNTVAVDLTGNHDIPVYRLKGHLGTVSILRRTAVQNSVVIDPGGILHVPVSSELTVAGDMTVNGQYDGVDGKLTFNGVSAQVFDHSPVLASPPSNFGEVTFSNTAGGITITGNSNPVFAKKNKELTGTVSLLKIMDVAESFVIDPGAVLTVPASGELFVKGSMTVNGQYDGTLGKLTFDGASAQVFDHSPVPASPPSNFGELVFGNTSGGITIIGNSPPIVAREAKTPSISEIVVTKSADITGPVIINAGAVFTVTATGEVSVGGDLTVNGQYNGVDGKLTLNGTTPQVIMYDPAPTSVASNFGEVSFSNTSPSGVHITSAPAAVALAIWLGKKGYDAYKMSSDINLVFQESFTLGAGATMEVMGARDITIGGDWTNNGGTFIPGTSTVIFNGTGTSHIGGTTTTETFYDLRTSCTDLINDMSTLNVQNLKITGGKFTGGPGTVTMKGNMSIIDGAVFDPNQGTLVFDGTVEQELNDGGIASTSPRNITVHSVVINNPSDYRIDTFTCCGVGLGGRVTVTGDLTFIAGKMKLNSDLFIESGASITGTSPSKYIVTNGSASLYQILPISGAEVKYPIGSASGYSPVTNKLLSVTGQPVTIGARVADGVSTAYDTNEDPVGSAIVSRNVLKTFFETGDIPTGDHITIQPQWAAADEAAGFNRAACNLGRYTGGQWVYSDATAATPGDFPGTYLGPFSLQVNTLSPFAVFSQSISNTVTGTTFCAGENITVNYTVAQGLWNAGNTFTAQLSDASGSFAGATNIGSVTATTSGTIAATIPSGTTAGTGYRIRVVSDLPATTGDDNGTDLTVNVCSTVVTLNLTVFLEGAYRGAGTMASTIYDLGMSTDPSETDMIDVNLWDPAHTDPNTYPEPDYTTTAVLHTNGVATMQFPPAVNGNSYYIAVKHRNSIETWSKLPVPFTGTTEYNFSTGLSQAYDDAVNPPMASMGGGIYAFYGGDVNHDGGIDASDLGDIDNDNAIFAFGYNSTDITGDGATDASDLQVVDNNSQLFLFYARPY